MKKSSKAQKNAAYINCFSEFLYSIRCIQFGETQETFGARCHLSQKTISRLENTRYHRMITLDSLCNIAKGVGVFPSQLLAHIEDELSQRSPKQVEEYRQCLDHYESLLNAPEDATINDVLRMLQASLMFFRLLQTKEFDEITDEDIDSLNAFFQK